jgi:hypothetical protein
LRFSRLVRHLTHAPHLTSSSACGLTLGKNDLMPSITSGGIARPGKVAACRLRCRVRGRCTFLSRRWSSFQTDPARSRLSIGTIGTSRDSAQRWVPTARSRLGSAFLRPVNIKIRLSPAMWPMPNQHRPQCLLRAGVVATSQRINVAPRGKSTGNQLERFSRPLLISPVPSTADPAGGVLLLAPVFWSAIRTQKQTQMLLCQGRRSVARGSYRKQYPTNFH